MEHAYLIRSDSKVSDVIDRNPLLLLMLEHLNIPLGLHEKTVEQLCSEFNIETTLFLVIANLYLDRIPDSSQIEGIHDITHIIKYLENSHKHYISEKFPLLTSYITEISRINAHPETELLKRFYNDYLVEVTEHLKYENDIVFPYVISLIADNRQSGLHLGNNYTMAEYSSHHDDIEEKLTDLKNLLIRYLPVEQDMILRRKLLLTLYELEFDLHIHSLIEEIILIPIVERLEHSIRV